MLSAKYQPNRSSGSGGEAVLFIKIIFFTTYKHCGHLEFQFLIILAIFGAI